MIGDENDALMEAVRAGIKSPCAKSKRGVVIWSPSDTLVYATGFNHPPRQMACDGSKACRDACGKLCIHAERHALDQLRVRKPGLHMLHVKVVDGAPVPSGPPSCWQCSRDILEADIEHMWLMHDDGLRAYSAREFHELTLDHHHLPVIISREGG